MRFNKTVSLEDKKLSNFINDAIREKLIKDYPGIGVIKKAYRQNINNRKLICKD